MNFFVVGEEKMEKENLCFVSFGGRGGEEKNFDFSFVNSYICLGF